MAYLISILLAAITLAVALINLKWKDKTRTVTISLYTLAVLTFLLTLVSVVLTINNNKVEAEKITKRESINSFTGVLSSEGTPITEIQIGDSGTIFSSGSSQLSLLDVLLEKVGPEPAKLREENSMRVAVDSGQLKVSARLRGHDGSMIVELINNEWKINPNKSWDRNYSKNALEVKDDTGDVVLQLRLVSGRVQFQGKFYSSNGYGIGFGKAHDGGGIMVVKVPSKPDIDLHIAPIFKYPSELHLGELH